MLKIIKLLRAAKDLQQNDMAEALGITRQSYSNKETGKTDFTIDEIYKVSRLIGVTVDELLEARLNEVEFCIKVKQQKE